MPGPRFFQCVELTRSRPFWWRSVVERVVEISREILNSVDRHKTGTANRGEWEISFTAAWRSREKALRQGKFRQEVHEGLEGEGAGELRTEN
jgi:hypothetical protein